MLLTEFVTRPPSRITIGVLAAGLAISALASAPGSVLGSRADESPTQRRISRPDIGFQVDSIFHFPKGYNFSFALTHEDVELALLTNGEGTVSAVSGGNASGASSGGSSGLGGGAAAPGATFGPVSGGGGGGGGGGRGGGAAILGASASGTTANLVEAQADSDGPPAHSNGGGKKSGPGTDKDKKTGGVATVTGGDTTEGTNDADVVTVTGGTETVNDAETAGQIDDAPTIDGAIDTGDNVSEPDNKAATLKPGGGWAGETQQPMAKGSPDDAGYDARSIARWDVVPYQTFDGVFEIGVVAFHMNGIAKVDFSVDGGEWTPVYEMTLNPRTGVWEYWAQLDASLFADDGEVEVRAIAWPVVGEPRVLQGAVNADNTHTGEMSLFLHANSDGGLASEIRYVSTKGNDNNPGTEQSPMATLHGAAASIQSEQGGTADGGVIYAAPGHYEFVGAPNVTVFERWLTISGAPDGDPSQVYITGTGADWVNARRLRFADCSIDSLQPQLNASSDELAIWFDRIDWSGTGPATGPGRPAQISDFDYGVWATDSSFHDTTNVTASWSLVRGCELYNIGVDAFRQPRFVVNTTVDTIGQLGVDGAHEDLIQYYTPDASKVWENVIFYGLTAIDELRVQPFFVCGSCGTFDGLAFVNHTVSSETNTAQLPAAGDHILFWNVTHPKNQWWLNSTLSNVSMRNSVFLLITGAEHYTSVDNNHFFKTTGDGDAWGTNVTVGETIESLFADPANGDFHPVAGGLLDDRVEQANAVLPVDSDGKPLAFPSAIGSLQSANGG